MENFVQRDDQDNGLVVTAPYARSSGEGVLVGAMFGVCVDAASSGASVVVKRYGVYTLPKATGAGENPSAGAVVYWNDSNKNITTTSTSNTRVGYARAAKGTGDTTVDVVLDA
jgi:predicted RecA/RadA family phage recombinase